LHLTRLASTAELIVDESSHWAIESYIPLQTNDLIESLLAREDAAGLDDQKLKQIFTAMADLMHYRNRPLHTGFAARYAEIDPDRDSRPIGKASSLTDANAIDAETANKHRLADARRIAELGHQVLIDAGYSKVERPELEAAVSQSSEWGVPLQVDFDVFDLLAVYARGDIIGSRKSRRWRNRFRMTAIDVAVYQRIVVVFKLREGSMTDDELEPAMLHLRMFKNVPKVDVDMLLPGTKIRISWFDRTRTFGPSLGGIGFQIYKLLRLAFVVAVVTYSIATILLGLLIAIIGYAIRSFITYMQTRNRYMLNLTRSLYYQKLDTNAGVAYRLLFEAESQRHREAVLAYYAIVSADGAISLRRLRRRAQRMLREAAGIEVDFRAADAVKTLESWGVMIRNQNGDLSVLDPDAAIKQIDRRWDEGPLTSTHQAG